MATCKDCLHVDVCCEKYLHITNGTDFIYRCKYNHIEQECKHFKDRSRFVELKHAEWEEHEDMYGDPVYCCSNCREEYFLEEWTPFENCYFYCPNCGAKMSKRGEENA